MFEFISFILSLISHNRKILIGFVLETHLKTSFVKKLKTLKGRAAPPSFPKLLRMHWRSTELLWASIWIYEVSFNCFWRILVSLFSFLIIIKNARRWRVSRGIRWGFRQLGRWKRPQRRSKWRGNSIGKNVREITTELFTSGNEDSKTSRVYFILFLIFKEI